MCFSPLASFTGGVIIASIGIATVSKVHKPSQIMFASIPLFFGFQQIAEGLLWLALNRTDMYALRNISTYIFLIMAEVIWPVIIPLSVMLMEKSEKKKKILMIFLCIGVVLSIYYSYCLLTFNVSPRINGFHIHYDTGFPQSLAMIAFIFYLTATLPPLFISSTRRMYLFGILCTLSCFVTGVFYTQFLTSVWCFFAALISGVIYWILSDAKKLFNIEKLKLLKI
jgi:hypothetical protein